MTISVAICTYNRSHTLARVLGEIAKQTRQATQVIIVDSSQDDASDKVVAQCPLPINYIRKKERTILPIGRNLALTACTSDIICFLDDDAIPAPKFLQSIMDSFQDPAIVGVTGPTISTDDDLKPREQIITDNRNRTRVFPWGEVRSDTRRWIPSRPLPCTVMIGANMSYRTDDLKKIGGFDPEFVNPSFREESDVQVSLRRQGGKFLYHPEAYVNHITKSPGGIEDIEVAQAKYFYLAGRNHRYFADKHFPRWLSRLSWLLWSRTPPCLWLALILSVVRGPQYLAWHKGLWKKP